MSTPQAQSISLHQLLKVMVERGGTDLHLTVNSPPVIRLHGHLIPIEGIAPLNAPQTKQLCYSILTDAQKHRLEENLELDLSFGIKGLARFRANIYFQRGSNLSCGGIFLENTVPRPMGTVVTLAFSLPGEDDRIVVRGEIVNARDGSLGMGIKFIDLPSVDHDRIARFVERRDRARREPGD